eukprot:scaffold72883_cov22-Prasinocladus_malaysianus.AAC.1
MPPPKSPLSFACHWPWMGSVGSRRVPTQQQINRNVSNAAIQLCRELLEAAGNASSVCISKVNGSPSASGSLASSATSTPKPNPNSSASPLSSEYYIASASGWHLCSLFAIS